MLYMPTQRQRNTNVHLALIAKQATKQSSGRNGCLDSHTQPQPVSVAKRMVLLRHPNTDTTQAEPLGSLRSSSTHRCCSCYPCRSLASSPSLLLLLLSLLLPLCSRRIALLLQYVHQHLPASNPSCC
jgi:hypothetical protein